MQSAIFSVRVDVQNYGETPTMHLNSIKALMRADLDADTERGRMVRSAGVTTAIKIGAIVIAFLASLIYARALGPHDYGLFAYVTAWVAIITIPVAMGLPGYLVREGAREPDSTGWLLRWADKRILLSGLIAAALMACGYFLPPAANARELFLVAAVLPLLNSLQQVRTGLLNSHGLVARSQWPNQIAGPMLMLAMLGLLWVIRGRLHPLDLMLAMVIAAFLPLAINTLQLRPLVQQRENPPQVDLHARAALPFMWLGGMYLVNSRVDLIMLGSMKGAQEAGIYAIAIRAAELVPFMGVAVNLVLAPRIAQLYHAGSHALLQRMVSSAIRRVFLATLPLALVLTVAAWWILYYLFGSEFTPAARPLQILAVSQLAAVAFGSLGTILNMVGQERLSLVGVGIALGLNAVLNAILIPRFGADGAAVATGTSLIVRQTLLWYWLRRRLGLRSSAFGF
jgi:O-antigen/teichoic acid export membrane protein